MAATGADSAGDAVQADQTAMAMTAEAAQAGAAGTTNFKTLTKYSAPGMLFPGVFLIHPLLAKPQARHGRFDLSE